MHAGKDGRCRMRATPAGSPEHFSQKEVNHDRQVQPVLESESELEKRLPQFYSEGFHSVHQSIGDSNRYSTEFKKNAVKFTQTWDILWDRKDAYETCLRSRYLPLMEEIGIHVAGEWQALTGDGPRIILDGGGMIPKGITSGDRPHDKSTPDGQTGRRRSDDRQQPVEAIP